LKLKLGKDSNKKNSKLIGGAEFDGTFKKSLVTIHEHCIIFIFFNTLTLKLLGLYFLIKICVWDVDRMLYKKQMLMRDGTKKF